MYPRLKSVNLYVAWKNDVLSINSRQQGVDAGWRMWLLWSSNSNDFFFLIL